MIFVRSKSIAIAGIRIFLLFILMLTVGMVLGQSNISSKWARFDLLTTDTAWKFKSGFAQPEYFTRSFNDSDWQTISNNYLPRLSPSSANWTGIGVFRKKINIPDSLKGRQVELMVNQIGNSDLLLDGKLLQQYGDVESKANNHVIYQQSIVFYLDSADFHVLSIYHSNFINSRLLNRYGLIGYNVALSAYVPSAGDDNYYFHHIIISLGIILSFCLFFWCVFAFYPFRKASLITALHLTTFSFIFFGSLLRDYTSTDLNRFIIGQQFWEIGFSCTYGWFLLLIYALYYKKTTWRSWVVGLFMVMAVLLVLFQSMNWYDLARIFMLVYLIEALRILILGLIKKATGFLILAIGFLLTVAGTLFIILDLFHFFPWYITERQNLLGIATDLSFPLTLALHLAWEFGTANRNLRKQLKHVEKLSEKTLQQEQEKQQLLSSQNELLEQQVTNRTAELNNSLQELKATQSQLIQKEKMASLGELTAGIAHEIQNPLNFVNNFAEINRELIYELLSEADKGNTDEVKVIAADIKDNSEKISHHGKRAESIVKGMLEHSRQSTGEKQPTDINALADEYLKLAYHGMRAKDKDFNVTMKTDFDSSIGKINIVSQDIGRVMLNLFNNAFYAVRKRNQIKDGYNPEVRVITKRSGDRIIIKVQDNGSGIPENIKDKIFQPFFTTKPTGQGTGLGLSLSYDIAEAHQGKLAVDTREGAYTIFTLNLPLTYK